MRAFNKIIACISMLALPYMADAQTAAAGSASTSASQIQINNNISVPPAPAAPQAAATPVEPEAGSSSDDFKDWFSLLDLLRSKGIEPSRIDWAPIEQMCLGLKETKDERPYNKCRYGKVLDMGYHASDRNDCQLAAKGLYPAVIPVDPDSTDKTKNYNYYPVAHTRMQLDNMRNGYISECMHSKGWADANSWQQGKRTDNY